MESSDRRCHKHPDRQGVASVNMPDLRYLCMECSAEIVLMTASRRAYGTGIGPEARAEANEAKAMQDEYTRGIPRSDYRNDGGKDR